MQSSLALLCADVIIVYDSTIEQVSSRHTIIPINPQVLLRIELMARTAVLPAPRHPLYLNHEFCQLHRRGSCTTRALTGLAEKA
jgi:hypothetical protein